MSTKKVVISNDSHLTLTKEMMEELFRRLGKPIYFYSSPDKFDDPVQPFIEGDDFFVAFTVPCEPVEKSLDSAWYQEHGVNQFCWDRECPYLVSLVEEWGTARTKMKAIEIPSDVEYRIETDGDGWGPEFIREKSRVWR
jgi:hypothetical protein